MNKKLATFSALYLAVCVTFADALFPWSAVALAVWIAGATFYMLKGKKPSKA